MKFVITTSLLVSLMFAQCSHPIALVVLILAQTMIVSVMIWNINTINWFSFILFLIFLGGLMVLFIYITSLASNEKFFLAPNSIIFALVPMFLIVAGTSMSMETQLNSMSFHGDLFFLNSMYSNSMFMPTIMTMIYLLLTLIVAVKIASKYEGPLRNMIFKKN